MAQTELLKITRSVKECVKDVEDKVDVAIDGTHTFIWSAVALLNSSITSRKGREGCCATDGEQS
jgi:hypothetical protein